MLLPGSSSVLVKQDEEGGCDVPCPKSKGKNIVDTVEALWLLGKGSASENRGRRRVRRDPRGVGPFHLLD